MPEGSFVYAYVVNPNPGIGAQLRQALLPSGDDNYSAVASASGMVTKTGK